MGINGVYFFWQVIKEILAARTEIKTTIDESKLVTYQPDRSHWPALIPDDPSQTRRFEKYYDNDGDPVTILREKDGQLIVNIRYLLATSTSIPSHHKQHLLR